MANQFEVLTWFTMETCLSAKNNLQFFRNCEGLDLASRFTGDPKKGETINVRRDVRFVGGTGEVHTAEDYIQRSVPVTVQQTIRVSVDFSNRDLMFKINDPHLAEMAQAAGQRIANTIDSSFLGLAMQATPNHVGTPAVTPTQVKTYNQARARQSYEGCPMDSRMSLLVTPDQTVEGVESGRPIFNPNSDISKQHETGLLAPFYGAKTYECQNLRTHQVGPLGGTPLANGVNQTGASIVTDGWTAAAALRLRKGDVITFANVFAVNPLTYQSSGYLRQFTVTIDVNSDGSGNATIPISPPIVTSGPYQNVTGPVADNSAVLTFGAASTHANLLNKEGLRFHKECFVVGTCSQPEPTGAVIFAKQVMDKQTGMRIRFIKDWDTINNKEINRFDCVPYFGVAIPEWACRIAGGNSV